MNNIKKPIILIGFSTKKNVSGRLTYEINVDRIRKLSVVQRSEIIAMFNEIQREIGHGCVIPNSIGGHILSVENYEEITSYIKHGQKLSAVKKLKEVLDIGLKDAKDYIDNFRFN